MKLSKHVLLTCVAAAIACASGGASGSRSEMQTAPETAIKRDHNTIVADDMKNMPVSNLYDVVQRLHPEWLSPRTSAGFAARAVGDGEVQVYIDSQRGGGVDMLRTLAIGSASALRFHSPSEAQAHFGNGNNGGVIQVISRTK